MAEVSAVVEDQIADLDGEPMCECKGMIDGPDTECPNPAKWIGKPHCGHPSMQCTTHKEMSRRFIHVCGDCGDETYPMEWRPM